MNGWSGGQYSVVRAAAGIALAARFVLHASSSQGLETLLHVAGAVWSVAFAVGWADRSVPLALAPTLIAAGFVSDERGPGQVHYLALAVLLHLATPAAPYGSLDALGRVDPGAGWRMSRGVMWAARGFVAAVLATFVLSRSQPYLALAWFGALACDPGWIRALGAVRVERLYYDGTCGLCQRAVRFVLAEDRDGRRFRFAPLQGPTFEHRISAEERRRAPDSLLLETDDGRLLGRSSAVLHLLAGLGGGWRLAAAAARGLPRPLSDRAYDAVASARKRVFAPPETLCPQVPEQLARRFDP